MKKILLAVAMVATSFVANAQDGQFNLGANVALPVGNAGDLSSFAIGVEANYLFELSDEFKLGPSVGYMNYFGKDQTFDTGFGTVTVEGANVGVMPIAAAARYNVSEDFVLGADLGVGIGVSNSSGSDFYYRPLIGYNVSENVMLQASYNGMDGFSSFGVGAMFSL